MKTKSEFETELIQRYNEKKRKLHLRRRAFTAVALPVFAAALCICVYLYAFGPFGIKAGSAAPGNAASQPVTAERIVCGEIVSEDPDINRRLLSYLVQLSGNTEGEAVSVFFADGSEKVYYLNGAQLAGFIDIAEK